MEHPSKASTTSGWVDFFMEKKDDFKVTKYSKSWTWVDVKNVKTLTSFMDVAYNYLFLKKMFVKQKAYKLHENIFDFKKLIMN